MTNTAEVGTLASRPIFEQLAGMRRDHWTGVLLVTNNGETRSVYVDAGEPVWATTDDPDLALGAYLCRRGLIDLSEAELEPASFEAQVFPETISDLAREHAEQLLLELFSWSRDSYACHRLPELMVLDQRFTTSFEAMLARGMTRVSNLATLRSALGPESMRLVVTTADAAGVTHDLAEETGVVLAAIRSGGTHAEGTPWPSAYRLHQCLVELKLRALVEAGADGDGVELWRLLARAPALADTSVDADDLLAMPLDVTFSTLTRPTLPSSAKTAEQPSRVPPVAKPPVVHAVAATAATMPTELPELAANAMQPEPIDLEAVAPLGLGGAPLDFDDGEIQRRIQREAIQSGPHAPAPRLDSDPPRAAGGQHGNVSRLRTDEFSAPAAEAERAPLLSAHEWFLSGLRFAKAMDLHNAVRSFQEAVRATPDNPTYRIELAKVMGRNPKWRKEAEEHLKAAAELHPFSAEPHLALARLYRKSGMAKRAIASYRTALQTEVDCRDAASELKELMAQQSQVPAAQSLSGLVSRLSKLSLAGDKSADKKGSTKPEPSEVEEVLS